MAAKALHSAAEINVTDKNKLTAMKPEFLEFYMSKREDIGTFDLEGMNTQFRANVMKLWNSCSRDQECPPVPDLKPLNHDSDYIMDQISDDFPHIINPGIANLLLRLYLTGTGKKFEKECQSECADIDDQTSDMYRGIHNIRSKELTFLLRVFFATNIKGPTFFLNETARGAYDGNM